MKKLVLATAVAATALLSACHSAAPKAQFQNEEDSLSYEVGLAYSGQAQMAMQQMSIDSAYVDEFLKGLAAGINSEDDKKKMAYNVGLMVGMNANMQALQSIENAAFNNDSTKELSRKNFLAGMADAMQEKVLYVVNGDTIEAQEAYRVMSERVNKLRAAAMEKEYAEEKQQNADWLVENAKKEGVQTLEGGVQYKVIKEGKGPKPTAEQTVKVQYEGSLIDGTVFDSSNGLPEKTANFPVNRVIKGMTMALLEMPVGSEWELYIPAELGYGAQGGGKIPPFSTLIFKLTLVDINK